MKKSIFELRGKPRIFFSFGLWVCHGDFLTMGGESPKECYDNWKNQWLKVYGR